MPMAAHGVTHPGRRATNEDALLVAHARGLFVVADGMGGHNAGEVASGLAIQAIGEFLSDGAPPSLNLLDEALRVANDHILTVAAQQPAGMGTTVVAALLTDGQAIYANVGDSRIYLWRGGHLTQLTRDDSWVSTALEGVSEDSREIDQHPLRHVLTKVVGLRPELQPSVGQIGFGNGDVLLLCSDGVHGSVPDAALAALLGGGRTVAEIADNVVNDAIARGATDNVSAIVVRLDE